MNFWRLIVFSALFLFLIGLPGTVFSLIKAVESLSISEEEEYWVTLCDLPNDELYAYIKISRTYPSGVLVASLWKSIYVDNDRGTAALIMNSAQSNSINLHSSFSKALQENFGFNRPAKPEEDKDIKLTIRKAKESCGDYKRRMVFSERFKDMLQYLGLATLFGGLVYLGNLLVNRYHLRNR